MRVAVSALLLLASCGGASPDARTPGDDADDHANSKVFHAPDGDDEEEVDDGLEVVGSRGRMDQEDIEEGLSPHAEALEACFTEQVGAQKWLGGKIELKWELDADGGLVSAQVSSGDLGAWPVEQCLLETARAITWTKPHGGPAGFTVPLEFSARGGNVQWWDEERGAATVSKRLVELDACDAAATRPTNVLITLYVGTRGQVQQAGFSSEQVIDDAWAACAHGVTTKWTLSDPKGKIAKLAFWFNPQDIASEWEE